MTEEKHGEDIDRSEEWEQLRATYLRSPSVRPESSAQGVHHLALLSSDVEQTIAFYQGVLEFPLTELFENRDYKGSTHFFFDISTKSKLLKRFTAICKKEKIKISKSQLTEIISDNWYDVRKMIKMIELEA